MNLGINLLSLYSGEIGGGETFMVNTVRALRKLNRRHHLELFASQFADLAALDGGVGAASVTQLRLPGRHRIARVLAEQTLLPVLSRRRRLDALLMPGNQPLYYSPVPQVVVIQDLHPFLYREKWPDAIPRAKLTYLCWTLAAAVRKASHLIVSSQFIRDELLARFDVDAASVSVVPYAAQRFPETTATERSTTLDKWDLRSGDFLLCVAFKGTHKNLGRLAEAWGAVQRASGHGNERLVLVGRAGPGYEAVANQIRCSSGASTIRSIDSFISHRELGILYQTARAFVLPSIYEGFGLPLLEALHSGLPVACSNAGPFPELAGDAAVYFDPEDLPSMSAALATVMWDVDARSRLREAGEPKAQEYSWDRTARDFLAVLETAGS
jgi:glycosyltransferase involved in cell wall biosynthesis